MAELAQFKDGVCGTEAKNESYTKGEGLMSKGSRELAASVAGSVSNKWVWDRAKQAEVEDDR